MILSKLKEKINFKKLILVVVAVLVVAQVVAAIVVSESFLNTERFLASEKVSKIIVQPLSSQADMQWLESKGESVSFNDGELSGLSVKNNSTSHSYVILFHPLTETPADMASYARHFYDIGFNVYIPRYIEKSVCMGIKEKEIVSEWVDCISENDSDANMFVFGIGIGGASALLSAGDSLPDNVKGIISDSAYSDINELFKENIKSLYGVSSFPTVPLASVYTKITRDWSFSQADILGAVRSSEIPILYIHGTEDSVVPVGQSNELYEVTRAKGTDHFTVHGADHAQTLNTDSEKYWREVDDFIRNSMDF